MENMGLAGRDVEAFVKSVDENYIEVNTQVREWMKGDDLSDFGMLIQPDLENVVTSSGFITNMPFDSYEYFGKGDTFSTSKFKQIEYYAWLFYKAVGFRKRLNLEKLNIYINYYGQDFLEDLKLGHLGEDTTTYLKLMLRQSEGFVTIWLYKDFKLQKWLNTEDDLKLNV
jgi:hypothetical protein